MAAGTSSRFAPLSYETHKSLLTVRGEVLIERQIRQIKDAGIDSVVLVGGYMKERFAYLREKFGVTIIDNPEYTCRNNPFESCVDDAYYAALYADGPTPEWCVYEGDDGYIDRVSVGGENAWYMMGHVFWSEPFSRKFVEILEREYDTPEIRDKLWEAVYAAHLDELKLRIRRYDQSDIFEFDSLDELRGFDASYIDDTRSQIIRQLAARLGCGEAALTDFHARKACGSTQAVGFTFRYQNETYQYDYKNKEMEKING